MGALLGSLKGLVFEHEKGSVSLGRMAFWATLGIAIWKWVVDVDITSGHLTVLLTLLGYNLGTKGLHALREVKGVGNGAKPPKKDEETMPEGDGA